MMRLAYGFVKHYGLRNAFLLQHIVDKIWQKFRLLCIWLCRRNLLT